MTIYDKGLCDIFRKRKKEAGKPENNHKEQKINTFFFDRLAAEGIGCARQLKYLFILTNIARMLKIDFSKAENKDIEKLCGEINNSNYKDWTKHVYMVTIKRFYKWLRAMEGQELDRRQYPNEVKWIIPKVNNGHKKLPSELLTIEDVKKLADATNNLRDRCFVLMSYESGCRIGELLNLRLKDIEYQKFRVSCKNYDIKRIYQNLSIRIIFDLPGRRNWLRNSPKLSFVNTWDGR